MTHFSQAFSGMAKTRELGYEKLARLTDLSPVFVWRLSKGDKNPSLATIYRLAKELSKVEPKHGGVKDDLFFELLIAALKDDLARDKRQRSRRDA